MSTTLAAGIFRRGGPKKELFDATAGDNQTEDVADLDTKLKDFVELLNLEKAGYNFSAAIWRPELKAAEIIILKKDTAKNAGFTRGGKTYLHIEETVYWIDRGDLMLLAATRGGGQRLLSVQEAYDLMVASGVSMDRYIVFSMLMRSGYLVMRHPSRWQMGSQQHPADVWGGWGAWASCYTGHVSEKREEDEANTGATPTATLASTGGLRSNDTWVRQEAVSTPVVAMEGTNHPPPRTDCLQGNGPSGSFAGGKSLFNTATGGCGADPSLAPSPCHRSWWPAGPAHPFLKDIPGEWFSSPELHRTTPVVEERIGAALKQRFPLLRPLPLLRRSAPVSVYSPGDLASPCHDLSSLDLINTQAQPDHQGNNQASSVIASKENMYDVSSNIRPVVITHNCKQQESIQQAHATLRTSILESHRSTAEEPPRFARQAVLVEASPTPEANSSDAFIAFDVFRPGSQVSRSKGRFPSCLCHVVVSASDRPPSLWDMRWADAMAEAENSYVKATRSPLSSAGSATASQLAHTRTHLPTANGSTGISSQFPLGVAPVVRHAALSAADTFKRHFGARLAALAAAYGLQLPSPLRSETTSLPLAADCSHAVAGPTQGRKDLDCEARFVFEQLARNVFAGVDEAQGRVLCPLPCSSSLASNCNPPTGDQEGDKGTPATSGRRDDGVPGVASSVEERAGAGALAATHLVASVVQPNGGGDRLASDEQEREREELVDGLKIPPVKWAVVQNGDMVLYGFSRADLIRVV